MALDRQALEGALATAVPAELAEDLSEEFLEIRRDVATETLGRASPGKFVETVVQVLQSLERGGSYDSQPDVDRYLRELESRTSTLPDGLRICASRLARAMYALRSKRSIVHKGDVDATAYDLRLLYAGAQWVLAELLALAQGIDGEDAARLVAQVQLPVGELVEALGNRKLVHGDLTIPEEVLVLLSTYYPDATPVAEVFGSLDRRSKGAVGNAMTELWRTKLLHRPEAGSVVLTERGLREAVGIADRHST